MGQCDQYLFYLMHGSIQVVHCMWCLGVVLMLTDLGCVVSTRAYQCLDGNFGLTILTASL